MKGGLVTSAVLHGLVLAWALVTIGAPKSFEVQDTEALPVDLVPIESITQIQQGDKKAPPKEHSNTKPTKKQTQVANAENVGENEVDLKSPPTPETRPTEVQQAAAPPKTDVPKPVIDPNPNNVKTVEKEDTDAPPPPPPKDVAPPTPPKPPTPPTPPKPPEQPQPPKEQSEVQPNDLPSPDSIPIPEMKPVPPQKPVEKPPEQKPVEKPAEKQPDKKQDNKDKSDTADKNKKQDDKKRETAKAASSKESDFNADEISALLNKEKASGGGAKRSHEEASLGGKKTTGGSKLSQSEMDALRGQIQNNWSVIPGMSDASDVRIKVHMRLDESGAIIGDPEVTATGGSESTRQALASGAYRAVMKSSPFKNLPRDKYDAWNEVIVNFDPSDLAL